MGNYPAPIIYFIRLNAGKLMPKAIKNHFSIILAALLFSGCVDFNSNEIPTTPDLTKDIQEKTSVSPKALTFNQAKKVLPRVYLGLNETFYCGCAYQDKTPDLDSCGYQVRKNAIRAQRIEWEHVVPAWVIGHQRQCWQNGGRKNCTKTDDVFKYAEGDLVNLVPVIGEVNADRSNFAFTQWSNKQQDMYGQCQTVVDFKARKIQPRAEVRGRVARIYFYMSERYGIMLSNQDKKLLCVWAKQYPVDDWEIKRNQRIQTIQGVDNSFVSSPHKLNSLC